MSLIACLKILIPPSDDELASYFTGKETGTRVPQKNTCRLLGIIKWSFTTIIDGGTL